MSWLSYSEPHHIFIHDKDSKNAQKYAIVSGKEGGNIWHPRMLRIVYFDIWPCNGITIIYDHHMCIIIFSVVIPIRDSTSTSTPDMNADRQICPMILRGARVSLQHGESVVSLLLSLPMRVILWATTMAALPITCLRFIMTIPDITRESWTAPDWKSCWLPIFENMIPDS